MKFTGVCAGKEFIKIQHIEVTIYLFLFDLGRNRMPKWQQFLNFWCSLRHNTHTHTHTSVLTNWTLKIRSLINRWKKSWFPFNSPNLICVCSRSNRIYRSGLSTQRSIFWIRFIRWVFDRFEYALYTNSQYSTWLGFSFWYYREKGPSQVKEWEIAPHKNTMKSELCKSFHCRLIILKKRIIPRNPRFACFSSFAPHLFDFYFHKICFVSNPHSRPNWRGSTTSGF